MLTTALPALNNYTGRQNKLFIFPVFWERSAHYYILLELYLQQVIAKDNGLTITIWIHIREYKHAI